MRQTALKCSQQEPAAPANAPSMKTVGVEALGLRFFELRKQPPNRNGLVS